MNSVLRREELNLLSGLEKVYWEIMQPCRRIAEMIYSGDPYHPGLVAEWAADWREAWEAAVPLHQDERKRLEYLERVSIQLYHRLKEDDLWSALASLADQLLAHETLEEEQVEEIVGEWLG